jgi:DNA-binding winged helix-turn-helix (wHTH) protein
MDASRRRVVVRDGQCVSLTRKEFELLQFLVENHDRVISADDILARVWGLEYVGDRDLVKQFIYRLRAKLEDDPAQPRSIVTVRGSGYAFEPSTKPSLRRLLQGASVETGRAAKPASVRPVSALPPPGEVSPAIPLGAPSVRPPLFPRAPTRSVRRVFRLSPPGAVALGLLLAAVLSFGFVEGAQGALPGTASTPSRSGWRGCITRSPMIRRSGAHSIWNSPVRGSMRSHVSWRKGEATSFRERWPRSRGKCWPPVGLRDTPLRILQSGWLL